MHATVVCDQTECLLQVKIPESFRSAFPLKVAGETHTATLSDDDNRQPTGTTIHDLLLGIQEEDWCSWPSQGKWLAGSRVASWGEMQLVEARRIPV